MFSSFFTSDRFELPNRFNIDSAMFCLYLPFTIAVFKHVFIHLHQFENIIMSTDLHKVHEI